MMDKSCIKKIGILRALQLGDLLCSIPAIRALRGEFPNAEIFLIGLPNASGFVQRFPHYFNGLIKFPGYPGLPEQPYNISGITEFFTYMHKQEFDLILQMQGNGNIVNPLCELFGARYTAGFYRPMDYEPEGGLFIRYPGGHEIQRHLALMDHLGIKSDDTALEFPLSKQDEDDLQGIGLLLEPGSYVCVHPGSRGSWRQWPVAHFAALADYSADRGKTVVLTGTDDELSIVEETAAVMKHVPLIAAGKTTLGAAGLLIKNAYALVSNCTGVSHIASAMNTPGVIISMDGEPERWGPLNKDILFTLDWTAEPDFAKAAHALTELFEKHQDKAERFYSKSG
jgi:ADP-heptose:LPS heptosyltransferase